MSHLFVNTFFDFGVVENFVYRAKITVSLYLLQSYSDYESVTMTVLKMTTCYYFRFVRHLENVQILLFTLLPNHLTIFSL